MSKESIPCHNCGKIKQGGFVDLSEEKGIIKVWCCCACYGDWYLK